MSADKSKKTKTTMQGEKLRESQEIKRSMTVHIARLNAWTQFDKQ